MMSLAQKDCLNSELLDLKSICYLTAIMCWINLFNDVSMMSMAKAQLQRGIGLVALTATGICSMMGASINVVPFMIHRSVPGIGPYVLPAFLFAAIPALLAAFAYANLSSAMPRAGGSYLYASRGLNPYLGFIASFSQWFGLSIVIGVIAYIVIPFGRDVAIALDATETANFLDRGWVRVSLALALLWTFVWTNIKGSTYYERIVIPLMVLMFILGGIVIITGFGSTHEDFIAAWQAKGGSFVDEGQKEYPFDMWSFFGAGAVLFSSFIGFDAIAQAGGEAKNPIRNLPLAIGLAISIVGGYYLLFSAAMYHTVPWQLVSQEAQLSDISAPGLLSYILSPALGVAILIGATIALVNDLPAMLLSVSRLIFAWSEDGIFPEKLARIHPKHHTPDLALIISGGMASVGIIGSHYAGDFFLGIDIMVSSMMVNFLLICISLTTIHWVNPKLAEGISLTKNRTIRILISLLGAISLSFFLIIHTTKDLSSDASAWYFRSTPVWLIVMCIGSLIYWINVRKLKNKGVSIKSHFSQLPPN
ncbi:MAG: APA family basic amino acid/polyamine antiporter [Cyclobacteriaceae bacterium]|jgi:APA family basic amino acid/polyamine antiporter